MKKSIIALCLFTCGAYSQPYGDWNLINETVNSNGTLKGDLISPGNSNKFVSHLVTGDDERAIWYELRTKQYGMSSRQTNFLVSSRGFNSGIKALKKECTK